MKKAPLILLEEEVSIGHTIEQENAQLGVNTTEDLIG